MNIFEFMHAHPLLTFFLVIFLCLTVIDITQAITGNYPPEDKKKKS